MDDDEQSSGLLGNYAWWQLGRWSAENAQQEYDAIAKLTGTGPVPVRDYNHALHVLGQWRAECERLQQVNAGLQAQLNAAKAHEAELRAWGNRCAADRDCWKDKYEQQSNQTWQMSKLANRFQEEIERLKVSPRPSLRDAAAWWPHQQEATMQLSSLSVLALIALYLAACSSGNVKSARDHSAPAAPTVRQPLYDPAMSYGSANATWAAPIYNRAGTIVRPADPGADLGRPDYEHAPWATGAAGGSRSAPPGTF